MICPLCKSNNIRSIKKSKIESISNDNFKITDSSYSYFLDLYFCNTCNFNFCLRPKNLLSYYENLVDHEYNETRSERLIYIRKLLKLLDLKKSYNLKLLDVGSGNGSMLEVAKQEKIDAIGIEPSSFLSSYSNNLGLKTITGTLKNLDKNMKFDIITCIDVIEHVEDPVGLINDIKSHLKPNGLCLFVTPDIGSIAAKIFRYKWWHFRIAHISYFNYKTLNILFQQTDMKLIKIGRPSWYFNLDYIFNRLIFYIPLLKFIKIPNFFKKIAFPLNLFDSYYCIIKKKNE